MSFFYFLSIDLSINSNCFSFTSTKYIYSSTVQFWGTWTSATLYFYSPTFWKPILYFILVCTLKIQIITIKYKSTTKWWDIIIAVYKVIKISSTFTCSNNKVLITGIIIQ